MKLENIYIIHYSKLLDRKDSINKYFQSDTLNLNFIEKYDQEEILNINNQKKKYKPDKKKYYKKVKLWNESAVDFF